MIPDYAAKTHCINELRQKDKDFNWSSQNLVDELTSEPAVQPYSLNREATLSTDASEKTIRAVLTQEGHPVIYVSRNLTTAQTKYSNIECEALAVVFAVTRLRQFLLGRSFTIEMDHKPLQYIFNTSEKISKVASARLACWAITLMAYDFIIKHVPGIDNVHADAMSRLQFKSDSDDFVCHVSHPTLEKSVIDVSLLRKEMKSDSFLIRLVDQIRYGNWSNCSKREQQFSRNAQALTIEDDLVYNGSRLYIPEAFRKNVIEKHHETHPGMTALKCLVKYEAWWPGMNNDNEQFVMKCHTCASNRPRMTDNKDKWEQSKPWERIHIDWLYKPEYGEILIIADAGSRWIEAFSCPDRSTPSVIKCLRTVFSRFGVPFTQISDNAKEFVCNDLKDWLSTQGCKKVDTPLYSPRSNVLAERAVQTLKKSLNFYNKSLRCSIDTNIKKVLFSH